MVSRVTTADTVVVGSGTAAGASDCSSVWSTAITAATPAKVSAEMAADTASGPSRGNDHQRVRIRASDTEWP